MIPKKINNVRIQLCADEKDNWNGKKLTRGEVGIAFDDIKNRFLLIVGNGTDDCTKMINENNVVISGVGAGYELPYAEAEVKGGIKIHPSYFGTINEQLVPKNIFLANDSPSYNADHKSMNSPWTTGESSDLRIKGDLYSENIYANEIKIKNLIAENKQEMHVAADYIKLHNDILLDQETEVEIKENFIFKDPYKTETKDNTTIFYYKHMLPIDVTFISITTNDKVIPINIKATVLEETILVDDNSYTLTFRYDGSECTLTIINKTSKIYTNTDFLFMTMKYNKMTSHVPVIPLNLGEYSGIKFYNYLQSDYAVESGQRAIAELSINSEGKIYYSTNVNTKRPQRKEILLTDMGAYTNGLLLMTPTGDSYSLRPITNIPYDYFKNYAKLKISGLSTDTIEYNPFSKGDKYITIDQKYCKNLIVNGQRYSLDNNNTITLGQSIWTDALKETLDSAVQKVTFDGVEHLGPNIVLKSKAETKYVSSDKSIVFKADSQGYDLSHYQPEVFNPTEVEEVYLTSIKPSTPFVTKLEYDERGHVRNYGKASLDLSNIFNSLKAQTTKIASIETFDNTIQTSINEQTEKLNNLTTELVGLGQDLTTTKSDLNGAITATNNRVGVLSQKVESISTELANLNSSYTALSNELNQTTTSLNNFIKEYTTIVGELDRRITALESIK